MSDFDSSVDDALREAMALHVPSLPKFGTVDDAHDWLQDKVDDPFVDNFRSGDPLNLTSMEAYRAKEREGCCGRADEYVVVAGKLMIIGCNYGH